MLQRQSVPDTATDKDDHFGFLAARRLGRGVLSLAGLSDLPASASAHFGSETRILNGAFYRFVPGLLRRLVPGLLAGACLAGTPALASATHSSAHKGAQWLPEKGVASYYGPRHQGRRTASGGRFEQGALTAAHPWLPFGTKVRVTASNGRSVVVTITDRLPSRRRVIDLSLGAARVLGIVSQGLAAVSLAPV
jgi:rare lipoprotein A